MMTPTNRTCALIHYWIVTLLLSLVPFSDLEAQRTLKPELENGGMESADDGKPAGWNFFSIEGGQVSLSEEEPFEGNQSALVDTSNVTPKTGRLSANLSQTLDAANWKGKRVRLRTAVKVSNEATAIAAQLWFRVDRPRVGNRPQMGAFDNR